MSSKETRPLHQYESFRIVVLRVIESFVYKSLDETISLLKITTVINNNPLTQLVRAQISPDKPLDALPKVTIRDVILSITKIFHASDIQILANNDNFKIKLSRENFQALIDKNYGRYKEDAIESIRDFEEDYEKVMKEISVIEKGELDQLIVQQYKQSLAPPGTKNSQQQPASGQPGASSASTGSIPDSGLKSESQSATGGSTREKRETPPGNTTLKEDEFKNESLEEEQEATNGSVSQKNDEVKASTPEATTPKDEKAEGIENDEDTNVNGNEETTEKEGSEEKKSESEKEAEEEDEESEEEEDENEKEKSDKKRHTTIDQESTETPAKKKAKLSTSVPSSPGGPIHAPPNKKLQIISNPLIANISSYKYASTFLQPVAESNAPDYYSLIKEPRDLKTIRQMIKDGRIQNGQQVERDILLMYANAIMYNKTGSDIYNWSKEMQVETDKLLEMFKESDDTN